MASRGPAPPSVPDVTGLSVGQASSSVTAAGLHPLVSTQSAPSHTPGLVYQQSPTGGGTASRGDTVNLIVAAQPSWHTVSSLVGTSDKSTPTFKIQGKQWRIQYTITNNTCSYGQCVGPTVFVAGDGGAYSFDLHAASDFTNLPLPAGNYSAMVSVVSGSPQFTLTVQDYY